jgi:CRISPR-associated protein Cas5
MAGWRGRTNRKWMWRAKVSTSTMTLNDSMIDLSILLEPPERTVRGTLVIEALAPLSMSSSQPGSYYQTSQAPSDAMLLGMIENALGWHLGPADRKTIHKHLVKRRKKEHRNTEWADAPWISGEPAGSESGYVSLLGHHLVFDGVTEIPVMLGYDDLWARQQRDPGGRAFFKGSRRYDAALEPIINRAKQGQLVFGDRKENKTLSLDELLRAPDDAAINYKSVRDRFPMFSISPTPRGYVVPLGPYRFGASTTPLVSDMIAKALADPAAPLYLGSNDGWVHATWEVL